MDKIVAETEEKLEALTFDKANLLQIVLIQRDMSQISLDTFRIIMTDAAGVVHVCMVGCKPNYTEFLIKAFSRMMLSRLTKPRENVTEETNEEKEEAGSTATPPDLSAGKDGPVIS
jgi:hypothetical protein